MGPLNRSARALPIGPLLALWACGGDPAEAPGKNSPESSESDGAGPPTGTLCGVEGLPPRSLRLLSRSEYSATVRDLFAALQDDSGASCDDLSDCDLRSESCEAGTCENLECGSVGFYLSGSHGSVVVAGSFNGWAASPSEGGWPLEWQDDLGLWYGVFEVGEGRHSYKFVVDGTWQADSENPLSESDGYGGTNSVLEVDCSSDGSIGGSMVIPDVAALLPVESRPQHYAYDNASASGLVTASHLQGYLEAARSLSDLLVSERERMFPCELSSAGCAEGVIEELGELAFRRPLTAAEQTQFMDLFAAGGGGEAGLGLFARVLLTSPDFLYRSELGTAQADGSYRLNPYETASLLSYTFWGTMPDAELRTAAAEGRLDDPAEIQEQARRLINDPKATPQIARFANMWLGTEGLTSASRSESLYPGWNNDLAAALSQEAGHTVAWATQEGGSWEELLLGPEVVINASLAEIYGVSPPENGWEVREREAERAGLLGLASVMAATSHSDQTSPVRRGLFVRERLLCQPLGAPPPEAGGVPDVDPDATTRERFEQHSSDPVCYECHQFIDPIGFGFEGYDAIGRRRDSDAGMPIDESGSLLDVEGLYSGTQLDFVGIAELAHGLSDARSARRCFVRNAWRFTHGMLDGGDQTCSLDGIEAVFDASEHDLRSLWIGLAGAEAFTLRREVSP